MGKTASGEEESFAHGLLEYPQYTRPQFWDGRSIPPTLTSGDHAKWPPGGAPRPSGITRDRRPDLWAAYLAGRSSQQ